LTLERNEWSASLAGHFTPGGRAPDTLAIRSWVGSRAGLFILEKSLLPLRRLKPQAVQPRVTSSII